jgi:hypothetical protein
MVGEMFASKMRVRKLRDCTRLDEKLVKWCALLRWSHLEPRAFSEVACNYLAASSIAFVGSLLSG